MGKLIGTIEARKPLMTNGEHATYKNKMGKTMYKFWLTIDGKQGDASSTGTDPAWKEGRKILYNETKREGKDSYNFSGIELYKEDAKGNPSEYKDRYNDPGSIVKSSFTSALSLVHLLYDKLGIEPKDLETIEKQAWYFHEWIMKDQDTPSKDYMYHRRSILETAIKNMQFSTIRPEKDKIKKAVEIADHWVALMMSINNEGNTEPKNS